MTIVAVKNLASLSEGQIQLGLGKTYTGPGIYDLGENSNANNFASYSITSGFSLTMWEARDDDGKGSSSKLTITSDNNDIVEGTFQFVGTRTVGTANPGLKHFTEGKFKVKLN